VRDTGHNPWRGLGQRLFHRPGSQVILQVSVLLESRSVLSSIYKVPAQNHVNKYFHKAKEHEVQMAAEEKLLSHFM